MKIRAKIRPLVFLFLLVGLFFFTAAHGQESISPSIKSALNEAAQRYQKGDFASATSILKKLENQELSSAEKAAVYYHLHEIYGQPQVGKFDSVIHYVNLEMPSLLDDSVIMRRYFLLGNMNLFIGQMGESYQAFQEVEKRMEYLDTTKDSFMVYSRLGFTAGKQGNAEIQLDYIEQLNILADRADDIRLQAMAVFDEANYYLVRDQYDRMGTVVPALIQKSMASGDSAIVFGVSKMLIEYYNVHEKLDSAALFVQQAINYADNRRFPMEEYNLMSHLADIQTRQGNVTEAKKNAQAAIVGLEKLGLQESDMMRYAYSSMGVALGANGEHDVSENYFNKELELAKKVDQLPLIKIALLNLVEATKAQGKYELTTQYLEELRQVEDSLNVTFNREQVAEAETRMGLTLKEQELKNKNLQISQQEKQQTFYLISIILLAALLAGGIWAYRRMQRDKALITTQKELVEQSLSEKEVLLKEIHHRVKNNLQIISSLLDKQARRSADAAIKKMMEDGQGRILSMALVHQNLYETENFSAIKIKNYIRELSQNISASHTSENQKIDIQINADDSTLNIDHAIPVGLILNELLTNSFKHAFSNRGKGNIIVQFHQKESGKYFLHFKDDGSGFKDQIDLKNSGTLGMNLVQGLTRQLDGELNYSSSEKGTEFSIIF